MAIDFRGERLDINTVDPEDFVLHLVRYDFAGKRAQGKVLDLACGIGYGSYFLGNVPLVTSVFGADLSEKAIDYAVKIFNHGKVRFSVESATKTSFPNASFDTIISLETVEHLKEISLFFQEIKRLLRPQGTLVMSVPNKKFFFDAGFANEFHFNEMYFNELSEIAARFFGNAEMYYQRFRQERYEQLRPKPEQKASMKRPKLLRFIPRPVKQLYKYVTKNIKYMQLIQKSILRRYGFDFDKFLEDNTALCAHYAIERIVDDIYNKVPGNFIVVWQRQNDA